MKTRKRVQHQQLMTEVRLEISNFRKKSIKSTWKFNFNELSKKI